MKRIGVIANCGKARAADVLCELAGKAMSLGLRFWAEETTAHLLGEAEVVDPAHGFEPVEAIIALGGDGTMLRAVRELDGLDRPLMGVNIGALGFLTSVSEENMERALMCLANNDLEESVRGTCECTIHRDAEGVTMDVFSAGGSRSSTRALNDVVISGQQARVVTLELIVDGRYVTTYLCDGVVVSTPTGSTGHSLSAGGPILMPESSVVVISPICPHTLSSRPLVLADQSRIEILVKESPEGLLLSVDGQICEPLKAGDSIGVTRSDVAVRFLHLPGHDHFSVLRHKLHWRGSSV